MASPIPGLLFVTMQPEDSLDLAEFNDWYNNEHGPSRLRLSFIINGYRYRSMQQKPEWLALYDISDMQELTREAYTSLRLPENKTQREIDVMKRIDIVRSLFDLQDTQQAADFEEMDSINAVGKSNILWATTFTLDPEHGTEEELGNWFTQEHAPLLSKIDGWRRSRWFKTSSLVISNDPVVYLGIHEFKHNKGMTPETMKEIISTPWAQRMANVCTKDKTRTTCNLHYTFGPAPRELQITTPSFTTRDGLTKTYAPNVIESYITTADGVTIPYRLEGAQSDTSPVIVLSNCILTDMTLWDPFLKIFLPANPQYRILRYNTRGRTALSSNSSPAITLATLSNDILSLLDALRIPRAILIGVSLGGATVLHTALHHPERTIAFVVADTNATAPTTNAKAWTDRIGVAENDASAASDPANPATARNADIVGPTLAEQTVSRWFPQSNSDFSTDASNDADDNLPARKEHIKSLIHGNSLSGFKAVAHALYSYDLSSALRGSPDSPLPPPPPAAAAVTADRSTQSQGAPQLAKALFLAGADDGILPATMRQMDEAYAGGSAFVQIPAAGHLPMVSNPEGFCAAVWRFLEGLEMDG